MRWSGVHLVSTAGLADRDKARADGHIVYEH